MNEIKVYTTEEAADILKVTKRTLYTYIKAGSLQATKIGKYWRIPEDNLKAFLLTGGTIEGSEQKEN